MCVFYVSTTSTLPMVEICNLASGSNGNCYYIGNDTDAVIVDAGIYHSRLLERMATAGLDIKKLPPNPLIGHPVLSYYRQFHVLRLWTFLGYQLFVGKTAFGAK